MHARGHRSTFCFMRMEGFLPGVPGSAGPESAEPHENIPPPQVLRYAEERLPRHFFRVSTDIRRQLEGGIETLEAAHARDTLLTKALLDLEWQQRTLRRLDTLRELVRQEPGIEGALARLRQRARAEDWPETEPALGLARKVERLRSRLEALSRMLLDMPVDRESSLVDNLARIEALLTRTIPTPVSPRERVLCQGRCRESFVPPAFLALFGVLVVIDIFERHLSSGVWSVLVGGVIILMLLLMALSSFGDSESGRFWLTGERLVWQPRRNEPIHIPLHAIRPGSVKRPIAESVRVGLVDGRHFLLRRLEDEDAERLVALLRLNCPASPPDESHAPVGQSEVSKDSF